MSPPIQSSAIVSQVYRLQISAGDFEEAHGYLIDYPQQSSEVTKRALLLSAIIAYARPFTQNEKGRDSPATSTVSISILRGISEPQRQLHRHILQLRNLAVAHSTYEKRPASNFEPRPDGFAIENAHFDVLREGINTLSFGKLALRLQVNCLQAITRAGSNLQE